MKTAYLTTCTGCLTDKVLGALTTGLSTIGIFIDYLGLQLTLNCRRAVVRVNTTCKHVIQMLQEPHFLCRVDPFQVGLISLEMRLEKVLDLTELGLGSVWGIGLADVH